MVLTVTDTCEALKRKIVYKWWAVLFQMHRAPGLQPALWIYANTLIQKIWYQISDC